MPEKADSFVAFQAAEVFLGSSFLAAVIDDDDLEVVIRREFEKRGHTATEQIEAVLGRNDDGDKRAWPLFEAHMKQSVRHHLGLRSKTGSFHVPAKR